MFYVYSVHSIEFTMCVSVCVRARLKHMESNLVVAYQCINVHKNRLQINEK